MSDHLGGASIDLDKNGTILQKSDYYPYGKNRVLENTDNYVNNYLFTGKELDKETDLQYFEARYYSPNYGRFYSQDRLFWELGVTKRGKGVLLDPQQLNSYSYARNNPLIYVDPSGEVIDYSEKLYDKKTDSYYYNTSDLTTFEALSHYTGKSGVSLRMPISDVSSNIDVYSIKEVNYYIGHGVNGVYNIDIKKPIGTSRGSSLILGTITTKIKGTLIISDTKWEFSGTQKFYDDVYDFGESKSHRSIIGNGLTAIGNLLDGKSYNIQIRGEKSISQQGRMFTIKAIKKESVNYMNGIKSLFKKGK